MKNKENYAFEKYVKDYDMKDYNIAYKYYHSYRVAALTYLLTRNLSEKDKKIAHIIGLYHDIGRFKQEKVYKTFVDGKFDHGDFGEEVLIKDNLIKEIPVKKEDYNIIVKAVKNHNKYKIEEGLNERELMHTKIIRDADKIDIMRSHALGLTSKDSLDPENDNFELSKEIEEAFYKEETIYMVGRKDLTTSEKVLSYLAYLYDLNYNESKEYILKNNLLEIFLKRLKHQEKYKKYIEHIKEYLERR